MNEDARDFYEEDEINQAVSRFNKMMNNEQFQYFDVFEIEGIVDHYLDEGKISLAQEAVNFGLEMHQSAISLKIKNAQILLVDGKVEEALEIVELVEKIEDTNSDVYLIKGSALILLDKTDEAIKAYEQSIFYNYDEQDELLYNIGITIGQAGLVEKAIEFLKQAHELNPKNELVLYELGYYLDKDLQSESAIKHYDKYLDIDPFNASVWYNLGITYNRIGNYKKAVEAYDYAIALNDEFEQSIFNKANALSNDEQYEEAIKSYQEYLEIDKDNDDALCYLGECYMNLSRNNEALVSYQKAIRLNKNNPNAWYGCGLVMWMEGQLDESQTMLKKAIKLDEENADFWLIYGKINEDLKQFEQAESAFEMSTMLDPKNAESWVSYAEMKYDLGNLGKAIEILKQAYKYISDDSAITYRLAAYLLKNQDEISATGYFEKALKVDYNSHSDLFNYYPEANQNESIKKLIKKYQSTKL